MRRKLISKKRKGINYSIKEVNGKFLERNDSKLSKHMSRPKKEPLFPGN